MFSADVLFVPVKVFAPTHTTAPAPFLPWPRRYLGHCHLDLETELTIQINRQEHICLQWSASI